MEKAKYAFVVNIPVDGLQFNTYVSNRSIYELNLVNEKVNSELTALYLAFEYLEKHRYPISVNMKKAYNEDQEMHLDRIKYIGHVLKRKKIEKELADEKKYLEITQRSERPMERRSQEDRQEILYEQKLLRQQENREKEQARIDHFKRSGFY